MLKGLYDSCQSANASCTINATAVMLILCPLIQRSTQMSVNQENCEKEEMWHASAAGSGKG